LGSVELVELSKRGHPIDADDEKRETTTQASTSRTGQ
jgi:hypothetical protein